MLVQQASRCDLADALDAGIPILGITDQSEKVRYELRTNPEFRAYAFGISHKAAAAVDLHDALTADTLREVFVVGPYADFVDAITLGRQVGC